jgi:hypothetical protein
MATLTSVQGRRRLRDLGAGFGLLLFAGFAGLSAAGPCLAGEMYDDEVQLEFAEVLQARESVPQSTMLTGTRGQSQGIVPTEPTSPSAFGGTFGVDFRSHYLSYGLVIQGEGLTTQSYLNLRYSFVQNSSADAFVNNLTGFVTTWSDFSSNTSISSPSSSFRNFTESDLIFGLSATFARRYNVNLSLTNFVSPAGAYGAGAFARAILLYDDTNQIATNFSLKPQFVLVYSFPGSGNIGLQEGTFLYEPGVTPNVTLGAATSAPLNIALPIRVGLGSDFFAGPAYGYFSVGPQFTLRLPFLSSDVVNTNLSLGYTYVNLGTATAAFAPNDSSSQHLFNLGLSVNF